MLQDAESLLEEPSKKPNQCKNGQQALNIRVRLKGRVLTEEGEQSQLQARKGCERRKEVYV